MKTLVHTIAWMSIGLLLATAVQGTGDMPSERAVPATVTRASHTSTVLGDGWVSCGAQISAAASLSANGDILVRGGYDRSMLLAATAWKVTGAGMP